MDCPNDEPAVGGGLSSSGFLNDEMALNTARPFDDGDKGKRMDDGWSIYVDNNNVGMPDQFMVGFVVCDKARPPGDYDYSDQSTTVDDGTQNIDPRPSAAAAPASSVAGCAPAATTRSGCSPSRTIPFDAGGTLQPETWQAGINNATGGGNFQSVTSYAVCRQ